MAVAVSMELSHTLTLNEEALAQIPELKRPVFIFEWLRNLDKFLATAQKSDIESCQKDLVKQLISHIQESPGPPTRKLIARNLASLFSVGDTFLLIETINKCNDILKEKEDSPGFLLTRLAAICCIGTMYEKLGRMMGRSYEETIYILIRILRSTDPQSKTEILIAIEKICAGMGMAILNVYKDIYKAVRHCLADRVMAVRCAATKCLLEMFNHSSYLYTTEIEGLAASCLRAFDGSTYEVRIAVAKLLGVLIAETQQNQNLPKSTTQQSKNAKCISLDEALGILMSGFLRGGIGFLKGTGEIIKGSSVVNREVRIGVTYAYTVFVQTMGTSWLEKNMKQFLYHILYLVSNPKAASSHVDAVYSRKCINFILRSVIGKMLGEKAQISACKEIAELVIKEMKTNDFTPENTKDFNQENYSQHLLVCALQEIGSLILSLGTTAHDLITDNSLNLIDGIVSVLLHHCQASRLAAAWCLRCICIAVPSQISPLIDRCLDGIEHYRSSPEAIAGYSSALAAILGSVQHSSLGIPYMKGKIIFNTAEELLRSANQNSRLSLKRTNAGWLLIGAIMTLGASVVRGLLPRMLLLWRNSFPRSAKELEAEKVRSDVFSWQVTLEGRAGALSSMHSFLKNCPDLVNEDTIRRLLTPVESALAMLTNITGLLKTYGHQLKASAAMVRLRLCETLLEIHPSFYESSFTHLLRMLVAEFTLIENPANTTTSQFRIVCHADDSVILGTWPQEMDHINIENQLQSNSAAGSGALEHDPCCVYKQIPMNEVVPGPLPLGVTVIDVSILLFGQIFPRVTNKHRVQMIEHFTECIKHTKGIRQEAIQMNVLTALLVGLRCLVEAKINLDADEIKKSIVNLIIGTLTSANPILRCAAGEAVGRIAQAVSDPKFTAELAQTSFDRLKLARDVATRTGHSLALGCLHRYVGGMGSSQHLNTSISILLALAQDQTSTIVQVWSLYALALIADTGGPMFRGYEEPSLSLAIRLLLNIPQSNTEIHQCIGKLLSALITTVGPELQTNTVNICMMRSSLLCACTIMQDHQDPIVQAEATSCLQQLHLFAPRYVNLASLVPTLCRTLSSDHLLLRKAAISCLRQLAQRESKEVCEYAMILAKENHENNIVEGLLITDSGLPGVFFNLLNTETDTALINEIHDTIISMLQVLAAENLTQWLNLCKDILTVTITDTTGEDILTPTIPQNDDADLEADDDQEEFHAENENLNPSVQSRWPTRVFAAECVRKIIAACEQCYDKLAHFDLKQAKEMHRKFGKSDFLVLHLADLIRMAFIAVTSNSDPLRLEGLKTLQEIIEKFSKVPEPEFPGHFLLEQFQAQVSAALRPAFSSDTSPHVTAAACKVCSTWIASNVAKDVTDLKRVHQLLVSPLSKFQTKTNNAPLYNESLLTLEKLSILKAWAEVFIVAMKTNDITQDVLQFLDTTADKYDYDMKGESLLTLVLPELSILCDYWFAALKDHALLSLPKEFASQLPYDGGAFYTSETTECSRRHYASSWPPILHAASLCLSSGFNGNQESSDIKDKFNLLFGVCMAGLCSSRSLETPDSVIICLQTLHTLLSSPHTQQYFVNSIHLGIELCNVLHRLILTKDNHQCQLQCLLVLKEVIKTARQHLNEKKQPNEKETKDLEEGGETGELVPGKSIVFAVLEICICVVIKQLPSLSTNLNSNIINSLRVFQNSEQSRELLANATSCMESLRPLCSPRGELTVLPTILYLTIGIVKEVSTKHINDFSVSASNPTIQEALHCLKVLVMDVNDKNDDIKVKYYALLQSALKKIIDLLETGTNENFKMDEVTVLLAIAMFIVHAPPKVVTSKKLMESCIGYFKKCLIHTSSLVRLNCVRALKPIFTHPNKKISASYVQALVPYLIQILYSSTEKSLAETDLSLINEIVDTIESLVNISESNNRTQILNLQVPVMISYLLKESMLRNAQKCRVSLHKSSLQWLMKVGAAYPTEFRQVISKSTHLRTQLEEAVVGYQQNLTKSNNELNNPPSQHVPTIKLKTNFSNF